jgi:hypothetical protein
MMSAPSLTRICWFVLRVSTALALTIAPYRVTFDGGAGAAKVVFAVAHAEDGGGEGGGGEGGGGGGAGSGGSGGDDGGGDDGGGTGTGTDTDTGTGYVDPATDDRVEVHGSTIKVVHPDGISERIENGRFKMKDAQDRTIIERAATAADRKRLRGS